MRQSGMLHPEITPLILSLSKDNNVATVTDRKTG